MKEKLKKSLRGELRLLRLTLTRLERLDYTCSEWLASGPGVLFLPFKYEGQARGATLNYDVVGTQRLSTFLKAAVTLAQYERMLRAVNDVCDVCVGRSIPTSELWLDPEGVFVTPEGQLRFVLVPLASNTSLQHGNPLSLLSWLGSPSNVRMVVEDDLRHVSAVGDWARRQSVFAPEKFSRFLAGEFPAAAWHSGAVAPVGATHRDGPRPTPLATRATTASGSRSAVLGAGALDPLELLGDDLVQSSPPTAVERISRTSHEPAPEEGADRGRDLGDTLSLSSGSADTGESAGPPVAPALDPLASGYLSACNALPDSGDLLRIERLSDGLGFDLAKGEQVLGRSASCGLHFGGNSNVSRRHAAIVVDGDGEGITLTDLGATNGTVVRGHRVAPHVPCHVGRGEEFLLADERFRVV